MFTISQDKQFSLGGVFFQNQLTVEGEEVSAVSAEVPVAQPATLTTRTDNNTGTLTMTNANHGITTGSIVDLYFTGGTRRQVVVGTVSGTSVPIDLGSGDNLPVATSAVTVCKVVTRDIVVTVADLKAIAVTANYQSQFTFMDADTTTENWHSLLEPATNGTPASESWLDGEGASPVSGTTIATVSMSHSDTENAQLMQCAVMA